MSQSALDAALLEAHGADDKPAIARAYARAAEEMDQDAAAFYLTHAYVYALDAGMPEAETYRQALIAAGVEPRD